MHKLEPLLVEFWDKNWSPHLCQSSRRPVLELTWEIYETFYAPIYGLNGTSSILSHFIKNDKLSVCISITLCANFVPTIPASGILHV